MDQDEITPDRIERALDYLARCLDVSDDPTKRKVVPIFLRLERDMALLREEERAISRASQRVKAARSESRPSELSESQIDEALKISAELVDRYGEIMLPYFEYFERLSAGSASKAEAIGRAKGLADSQRR